MASYTCLSACSHPSASIYPIAPMVKLIRSLLSAFVLLFSIECIAQPVANFSASVTTGCAPMLVNFNNTSTGATSYSWDFGNGATSVLVNPSTTYTSPGTYTVKLTAINGAQSNTKTITNYITVLGAPIVNFSANPLSGCPGQAFNFSNTTNLVTPGPGTWNWSFGDGSVSSVQNPTHIYQTPGTYNISLIATNSGGCTQTLTKPAYVQIFNPPVATFSVSSNTFCTPPASVNFTPTITGNGPVTYVWNYGNGTSGTANSVTYNAIGTYNVTLVATDANGCKDTASTTTGISVGTLSAQFTGPTSGCVFSPASFFNASIGGGSILWNFGDGTTDTATNPVHVWTTPGTYTVKLKIGGASCQDSISKTIIIRPKPSANFNFSPANPCPAPQTINFTNTSSGASTYLWDFGNGNSATTTNPAQTFSSNTTYSVTLISTSAFGCRDTIVKPVTINPLVLVIGADKIQGCVPLPINFSFGLFTNVPAGLMYPSNATSISWQFGTGATSNQPNPSFTYTTPGTYTVTLQVTTANGCTVTSSLPIYVGVKPKPSFTATPINACVGQPVVFTNTSTNANGYVWNFGDGGGSTDVSPIYSYSVAGTYSVTLTAVNNGCDSAWTSPIAIVVSPPTAYLGYTYNCDTPKKVAFRDSSIGATSRLWLFGDGGTSTQANPSHTYANFGTYTVKLIAYNNPSGCTDTVTQVINILNNNVQILANDTAICKGDSVKFTASFAGGAIALDYEWTVAGVYYPDSAQSLTHTFPLSGKYDVIAWIKDANGCWDSLKKSNWILVPQPVANFTAIPLSGCAPLVVTFTDQSTDLSPAFITTRAWTFGNGNSATVSTPTATATYPNAGVYTVNLKVTDNVGCTDTITKAGFIEARKPTAAFFVADPQACLNQPLTFSSTSSGVGLSYFWNFGDGSTSTQAQPIHAYSALGTYTVKLVVTNAEGCKDSSVMVDYINITQPIASFSISDTLSICPPLQASFTNNSTGATTYSWSFGDGNSSTFPNPNNVFTAPAIYPIQLIATDAAGCSDTATGTVNILGYNGSLTYTPLSGCAPLEVSFSATLVNVPSIIWDFSDGTTTPATSSTITHVYTTPGKFVPKLILSDGAGCLNSSVGTDTIKIDGILGGFINGTACALQPVLFSDTSKPMFSPITDRLWNFNNGQGNNVDSSASFSFPAGGIYPVTLIVTNANGCKDTIDGQVLVNALPTIQASGDTIVCLSDPARLSSTGGVSYTWLPVTGLNNPNIQNPLATPTVPTMYYVTGTDANGCVNVDSAFVNLKYKTVSTIGAGGAICADSMFQLQVSGAQLYSWSPAGSLDNPNSATPIAMPGVTTTYTVIAREASCIPDTSSVTVVVYPKPQVDAGPDQTIVAGNAAQLIAVGSQIQRYSWSPSATLSCDDCAWPTARPFSTTDYLVIAYSSRGCRDSDIVRVNVLCDQSQLFVPNTFTPNGDGQNDVFYPRGEGIREIRSFRIYNRWGEVLFERNNIPLNDRLAAWDGTYKGNILNPDTYVYVIEGICESGESISWKGDITLIR